jgi:TonB family protein
MIMRASVVALLFAVGISVPGGRLTAQGNKPPPECIPATERPRDLSDGPFKYLPGESYKREPVVGFQINEDGIVSHIKVIQSSGVRDIDRKVAAAAHDWKFKPQTRMWVPALDDVSDD